jgi:mRNA-degrading endonuclease toxin of MazEF toxin-antitoxin module
MSTRWVRIIARTLLVFTLVGTFTVAGCKRKSPMEQALDETKKGLKDLGNATIDSVNRAASSPAVKKAADAAANAAEKARDAINDAIK